jgi:hypothetical protein
MAVKRGVRMMVQWETCYVDIDEIRGSLFWWEEYVTICNEKGKQGWEPWMADAGYILFKRKINPDREDGIYA